MICVSIGSSNILSPSDKLTAQVFTALRVNVIQRFEYYKRRAFLKVRRAVGRFFFYDRFYSVTDQSRSYKYMICARVPRHNAVAKYFIYIYTGTGRRNRTFKVSERSRAL